MPKRKRNSLGKVKHYRQRSYTRKNLLRRRILKWALGLAALFLVGWLVAGPVVDFGSGLWYSLKNRPAASDSSAPQPGSDPAASGSTPEDTPEPEEPEATPADTTSIVEGSWTYVSLSALTSEDQAAATAADLASQGVSYAVITLKDAQGYVYYDSQVALAAQSKAGMLVDAAMAARVFKEAGIVPVAALSAFEDPKTPYIDREIAVYHTDYPSTVWLNAAAAAGGVPWLDPTDAAAQQYIADLMAECKALGYDQFLLSGVQFPSGYSLEKALYDAGLATEIDKTAQLAAVITAWQQQADADGSVLWFEYPADQAALEASDTIGSLAGLGVRNLVLDMDALSPEDDGTQRTAALTAASGADHLVLHTGVNGSFER